MKTSRRQEKDYQFIEYVDRDSKTRRRVNVTESWYAVRKRKTRTNICNKAMSMNMDLNESARDLPKKCFRKKGPKACRAAYVLQMKAYQFRDADDRKCGAAVAALKRARKFLERCADQCH